ncbi:hypothetical protein [Nonomuraea sp. SYSU D8015]|uniref:hypothetical protein n=1 Tax=Nonomuraea sp. SYSU D8015 TaxID=2593644 RepID=UPI0016604C38|nr:hypothetical protein [Nonomuraea sp. SYSU D8015]
MSDSTARSMRHLDTEDDVRAFAVEHGFDVGAQFGSLYVYLPSRSATIGDTIIDNGPGAEYRYEVYNTATSGARNWNLDDEPE